LASDLNTYHDATATTTMATIPTMATTTNVLFASPANAIRASATTGSPSFTARFHTPVVATAVDIADPLNPNDAYILNVSPSATASPGGNGVGDGGSGLGLQEPVTEPQPGQGSLVGPFVGQLIERPTTASGPHHSADIDWIAANAEP
jgi:hypothetical protein